MYAWINANQIIAEKILIKIIIMKNILKVKVKIFKK